LIQTARVAKIFFKIFQKKRNLKNARFVTRTEKKRSKKTPKNGWLTSAATEKKKSTEFEYIYNNVR